MPATSSRHSLCCACVLTSSASTATLVRMAYLGTRAFAFGRPVARRVRTRRKRSLIAVVAVARGIALVTEAGRRRRSETIRQVGIVRIVEATATATLIHHSATATAAAGIAAATTATAETAVRIRVVAIHI